MLIMLLLPLSRVLYVLLALLPVTVPFRVQDSLDHPFAWLMLKYQEWLLLHINCIFGELLLMEFLY